MSARFDHARFLRDLALFHRQTGNVATTRELEAAADEIDRLRSNQRTDADRAVLDAARHLIDLAINESRIVTEAEHMLAFQVLVDADRARRETQP